MVRAAGKISMNSGEFSLFVVVAILCIVYSSPTFYCSNLLLLYSVLSLVRVTCGFTFQGDYVFLYPCLNSNQNSLINDSRK